ncbi:MAG: hypothetical protein AB7K09_16420 [Planctomycetota bacterium]
MNIADWLAKPGLSKDEFAQLFELLLRAAGESRPLQYDADSFLLVVLNADGTPGRDHTNLTNFYAEYQRVIDDTRDATDAADADAEAAADVNSDARTLWAQRTIAAMVERNSEVPDDYDDAMPNLRPRLWSRAGLAQVALQLRLRGEPPEKSAMQVTGLPVGGHLLATVAYDLPHTVRSLPPAQLETWGVSLYVAIEAARENLGTDAFECMQIGDGLFVVSTGDSWDASRILLPQFISQLPLKGEPLAMVPARDTLLLTGSDDVESQTIMLALAEERGHDPRPLLPTPLIWRDDLWHDWQPPPGHPHAAAIERQMIGYLHGEYATQKDLLSQIHEQEGTDIFVASYSAMQSKDGDELFSYAVWSEGVVTLLPHTTRVAFMRPGEDGEGEMIGFAPFDRVRDVCGDLMLDTDMYPRRWFVNRFPADEQLAAILGG